MTDHDCKACGLPMEAAHRDPFLCDICLRELEQDLASLETDCDSQADGVK